MKPKRGRPKRQKEDDDVPICTRFSSTFAATRPLSASSEVEVPSIRKVATHGSPPKKSNKIAQEQDATFLFDKAVRNAMKPLLTHQFKVQWRWPISSSEPHKSVDVRSDSFGRCLGPTSIVELRGDPRLERGSRRVALLLSCSRRFMLPLLPEPRDGAMARETGIFWCIPSRPYQVPPPPQFAELVVGTVQELEVVKSLVEDASCSPDLLDEGGTVKNTDTVQHLADSSPCRIGTYFFHSLPYRMLWSFQFRDCLIVSLPCEERLLSLSLRDGEQSKGITSRLSTTMLKCMGSFRLPPYVVPLDMSEVYERPFLAVGTVSHGVIIVFLGEHGVCETIAHRLPLTGLSTSMFPVTRVCTVFPPLSPDTRASSVLGVSEQNSSLLSQCLDGTVLCCSPFESRTVLVRCASAGCDGCGFELPPPTRFVAGFLCSTPYCSSLFGPLIATVDGKILHFVCSDNSVTEADGNAAKQPRVESYQHYGSFNAMLPEIFYGNATRQMLSMTPNYFCEGGAVLQKVSHSSYKPSFVRHWLCISTLSQEIILFDRKVANYVQHSSFTITVPPYDAKHRAPASNRIPEVIARDTTKSPQQPRSTAAKGVHGQSTKYPDTMDDCITGLSWSHVEDGELQIVVAHHQNWLTIVTWKL